MREEMNRAGARRGRTCRTSCPPSCGRRPAAGTSSARSCCKIKDRHERDFLFGPTHEEVITDIVRKDIRSYRQLPVNFYQIQAKFRDEIRPRFGVMRGARVHDEGRVLVRRRSRRADEELPGDVRRLRAHLHAARTSSSAPSRPTPARSAASPRTSSRCSPTPARTRSRSAPTSQYAANVEQAEALAPTPPRARQPRSRWRRCRRRDSRRARQVTQLLGPAARAQREVPDGPRAGQACRCCSCAAITWATR